MANRKAFWRRRNNRDGNDVQNTRMRRVPKKSPIDVQDVSRIRVLDARPFRIHNAHLAKDPESRPAKCMVCRPALGAITGLVEAVRVEPEVDTRSRADEKRAASSAFDRVITHFLEQDDGVPEEGEV